MLLILMKKYINVKMAVIAIAISNAEKMYTSSSIVDKDGNRTLNSNKSVKVVPFVILSVQ